MGAAMISNFSEPPKFVMQSELQQWGKWARGVELSYGLKPYVCPTYTMMLQSIGQRRSGGDIIILLDDSALLDIDHLVGQLKERRPDLYQWVRAHYLSGYKVPALAAMTKVSQQKIDKYLAMAEVWLESRMEILCEAQNRNR